MECLQFLSDVDGQLVADSLQFMNDNLISFNIKTNYHSVGIAHFKEFNIDILTYNGEEEDVIVGTVKIHQFLRLHCTDKEELYEWADGYSYDLGCFISEYIDSGDSIEANDDGVYILEELNNITFISEVKIKDKYKGKGFGKACIMEILYTISKSHNVVLTPFAIEDRYNEEAHKRVKKFWLSLGFTEVAGTEETYYHIENFGGFNLDYK